METDLFRWKSDTVFGILDVTRDSYLDQSDFDALMAGIADDGEVQTGGEDFRAAADRYWNALLEVDADGDSRINAAEFAEQSRKAFREGDRFDDLMAPLAALWFSFYDSDRDGGIEPAEWEAAMGFLGRSSEDAQGAFARLDTDGDGRVSKEEFVELVRMWWATDDESSPGNWIFGPPPTS